MTFRYAMAGAVTECLLALKPKDRSFLIQSFQRIAADPNRKPDFIIDQPGERDLHVRIFDRWQITYWVDQWEKEVRINQIRAVKRR
jgi:hypothetical protein